MEDDRAMSPPPLRFAQSQSRNASAAGSPNSDGTLVAFEEDAIYFKPISFSPIPSRRVKRQSFIDRWDQSIPSTSQTNLGLDISVDLLTKELSAALASRHQEIGSELAALQVWVMIEAYEKLLERASHMDISDADKDNTKAALSSWLTSLHSLHRSLTSDPAPSESDYDGMDDDDME
jgi:hypothetical protein